MGGLDDTRKRIHEIEERLEMANEFKDDWPELALSDVPWLLHTLKGCLSLDFRNRSQIEKEIVGALKEAIDAHGPIVLQNRSSAAKRVYKSLKELAKRNQPEPEAN